MAGMKIYTPLLLARALVVLPVFPGAAGVGGRDRMAGPLCDITGH